MSVVLKHTARVAALGLLVACASGCGTDNPVGPSMARTPTVETSASALPIEAAPGVDDGVAPPTVIQQPTPTPTEGKVKKNSPGRRLGWFKTH